MEESCNDSYTLFFYKKHNYKKHRPTSAKTLRNIQGYSRKPKKHFIEEIMVKRLKITFPRYLHWRNINLFCSYSHCVPIQFLKAISKRLYLTLRLCYMLAKKHLRNILTQKLEKHGDLGGLKMFLIKEKACSRIQIRNMRVCYINYRAIQCTQAVDKFVSLGNRSFLV